MTREDIFLHKCPVGEFSRSLLAVLFHSGCGGLPGWRKGFPATAGAFLFAWSSIMAGPVFPDWPALESARHSKRFSATVSDMLDGKAYANGHPRLTEELLFIQSNARVVVGQNPRGAVRFAALPTRTYPVPTGLEETNDEISYGAGMFYEFDFLRAPALSYQIQLEGQERPTDMVLEGDPNQTYYAADFLPLTWSRSAGLETWTTSYAPLAENGMAAPLAPAPLPGPAGFFYILRLKNVRDSVVSGSVFLNVSQQLNGEEAQARLERSALILSSPKGALGVQVQEALWEVQGADSYRARKEIELEPGAEAVIVARVAFAEQYAEIIPLLLRLYLHSGLEWLNNTAHFWEERLGRLRVSSVDPGSQTETSRDLYVRCLLDNFCCLQTNDKGKLVSFFQGVPREGTIWGIDYEPLLVSVLPIAPELVKAGIEFVASRNRPPRSQYKDHSLGILVSPLIVSRKWLEMTGDADYFRNSPQLIQSFRDIFETLEELRSPDHVLYPSRYSSDGPVGRRYDHGTNAKVAFAFDSYAYILEAVGEDSRVPLARQRTRQISDEMSRLMTVEGPFGRQISGGTNLGDDSGGYYLPEEVLYYDGEDTGTHLAPLYGLYDFNFVPWVNYHRFARSIFCPSYEPELGALRWLPSWKYSLVTGTGFFSRLAGSVSRSEMRTSLDILLANAVDTTGSVYWWPISREFKRGIARCSQGQGSWAWQYLEEWLGLKVDALSRTLTFAPRGLPQEIHWKGWRAGPHLFDLDWKESSSNTTIRIHNRNSTAWSIRVGIRPFGAAAESELDWHDFPLEGGQTLSTTLVSSRPPRPASFRDVVAEVESKKLAVDEIVFERYGTPDPLPDGFELWKDENLDLRFFVRNASPVEWTDVRVSLISPSGWTSQARPSGTWPRPQEWLEGKVTQEIGSLRPMESVVAPFRVKGPHKYSLERLLQGKSWHYPAHASTELSLATTEVKTAQETEFTAELSGRNADGSPWNRILEIPVHVLPAAGKQ